MSMLCIAILGAGKVRGNLGRKWVKAGHTVRNYANHNPQWHEPELNSLSFIQAHAPHAQAYRAFNSYSIHPFADPIYQGVQADLFYCGPAGAEKTLVEQLIADVGQRPIYLGDSTVVEEVDGVIRLWAALVLLSGYGHGPCCVQGADPLNGVFLSRVAPPLGSNTEGKKKGTDNHGY
jgi:predicted dinucleotide-binding enzyme